MRYRHIILPLCLAVSLSGCIDTPPGAIVTDYNGASVKVQVSSWADHDKALAGAQTEAQRICGQAGKRHIEYASEHPVGDYYTEMLFTCT